MSDGKALVEPRMKDARLREPGVGDLPDPFPRHAILLAAPPKRASPAVSDGHHRAGGDRTNAGNLGQSPAGLGFPVSVLDLRLDLAHLPIQFLQVFPQPE